MTGPGVGALPPAPLPTPNRSSRNLASCECREKPSRSLRRHHCSMCPPSRMRHLLRCASSCRRFSRRRQDTSPAGEEAMCTSAWSGEETGGRCGAEPPVLLIRGVEAPRCVWTEACSCGEAATDSPTGNLNRAAGSTQVLLKRAAAFTGLQGRKVGLTGGGAGRTDPSDSSPETPWRPTPTGPYLCAPTRPHPDCACASPASRAGPELREDRGPPRERSRRFSFKRKPCLSAAAALARKWGPGLRGRGEAEAHGVRLRTGCPAQRLPGTVVPRPESLALVESWLGRFCGLLSSNRSPPGLFADVTSSLAPVVYSPATSPSQSPPADMMQKQPL
ncbi:hypothetical protein P7K49_035231 [Saguinus oedipus]|uniref:Uncharacterized protein n=1 Tax=Saguinus oedipus TaxID=9490 RepID=A0ABQ9TMB8_SAGOE|nr:hypothetical protein P7K49_035231 [Saguinus oedipus]